MVQHKPEPLFDRKPIALGLLLAMVITTVACGGGTAGRGTELEVGVHTNAVTQLWRDDWKRWDVGVEGTCQQLTECAAYQPMTCTTNSQRYRTYAANLGKCDVNGTNACLATDPINGLLYFHGENYWSGRDSGFPLISKDTFSRTGYISAEIRARAYCGPALTSGCFFGLTLFNGESNYREVAYQAQPGSTSMPVWRYAGGACNPSKLNVTVGQGTWHKLRIDYFGQDGGKWVYYVDDIVRQIENAGPSNLGSILQADPRVGLFFVGSSPGTYVEGTLGALQVWTGGTLTQSQTIRVDGVGVTSSARYAQEILSPGANVTRVRLYLGATGQKLVVSAYTDSSGKPGILINETSYTADRGAYQDVPLWVPGSYSKIWLVVRGQGSATADIGTSALPSNTYPGALKFSNDGGATWSIVNSDLTFKIYTR